MWADPKYGGAGVTDFRYEQVLIEENSRHGEAGFFMTLHSRILAGSNEIMREIIGRSLDLDDRKLKKG